MMGYKQREKFIIFANSLCKKEVYQIIILNNFNYE